jgi:hypothetical protein
MKGLRSISMVALCLLSATFSLYSQAVNGSLVGTVTDSTGGLIAGAKVTLTETNTKIVKTSQTNSSGGYEFLELPPGTYSVAAELTGFKKAIDNGIVVQANNSPRVDLKLETGNVSETIEVKANANVLQTERADTGSTVDALLVEELPLGVNRNYQSLLDLVPGTSVETFQHSQFFNASSSLQTNVNGQPRMGNNYQIEGIDNNERTGLLQILISPAEAIQQVSISTSNHDPELGRSTGAVVNVQLKSGTNQIHGGAYEYIQNSAFDARAFFNPSVGHLAYNYFGGSLGGPIKKNKIFYFGNYLRTEDHEANTNLETIPDVPFTQGNLSGDPTHQVYDPATGDPTKGTGRVPFPGNIIPQSRINPVSAKILSTYLPATNQNFNPTTQTNDYYALLPFSKTNNQVDSKVDWNRSEKDRFSARFSFAKPVTSQAPIFGAAGGPAQSAFEGIGMQKTYSTGINWNHVFGPTLLTEVRVGVAHYHNDSFQSDYGKNDATAIGIPGVNLDAFTSGFPTINVGGYSSNLFGYSASLPWDRAEANIDIVNSWTKIIRNHTIKFGFDLRRVRDDLLQDQTYGPRGVITFGAAQTALVTCTAAGTCSTSSNGLANDMASFLLDTPNAEQRDVNTYFPAFREWEEFSYVADNWQVTPKLTVNLGLRWEIYNPPTPHFPGGFSNYNPSNNTLVLAGIGGNPINGGLQNHFKYFAPRIGLAYRVDEKTVVRTGFGISYTPYPDNTWMYNFPVRSNNSYTIVTGADSFGTVTLPNGLPGTFANGFPAPDPVVVPSNGIITNPNPTTQQFYIPTNYKNGYIETWNFAIQRQLPWALSLDVAYVGSHGVDTPSSVNLNAGQVIGAGTAGEPFYAKYGTTAAITENFVGFSSSFNSLQVKFDRRFSGGLTMTTAFTWQKAMDFETGDDGAPYFYAGQGYSRNWARADFDRTLNYIQSYVYQLPFGKGKQYLTNNFAGKVIGGWSVSGIFSARTGTPLSFTGNNTLTLGTGGNATLQQVAPITVTNNIGSGVPWFSVNSFVKTPNNVQGNTGRNIWSGPNLWGLNASVSRTFPIKERLQFQLRLEALNAWNKAQFANPNTSSGPGNAAFGAITSTLSSGTGVNGTGGGRAVTLAAKFIF